MHAHLTRLLQQAEVAGVVAEVERLPLFDSPHERGESV